MHYKVKFYNDMGHLMIENYDNMPQSIRDFAYEKAKQYLNYATDTSGMGCRFYVLKRGLSDKWTYNYGRYSVEIDWSDCITFNTNTMRYV